MKEWMAPVSKGTHTQEWHNKIKPSTMSLILDSICLPDIIKAWPYNPCSWGVMPLPLSFPLVES